MPSCLLYDRNIQQTCSREIAGNTDIGLRVFLEQKIGRALLDLEACNDDNQNQSKKHLEKISVR